MPTFLLRIRAEMEGVASFSVPASTQWDLDVKQPAGDETRRGVVVDPDDEQEVPNSKNGTAHFMIKWPGEKQHAYLKIVSLGGPKGPVRDCQSSDDTGMVAIAAFECRGLEPVRWTPTGPHHATATSGTVYDDVAFRGGDDWCEYDEKSGDSLVVGKDIAHEFVLHRG